MKLSIVASTQVLAAVIQAVNGEQPLYKDPEASIEDRVRDLLPRMTVQEKTSQLIQGDIRNYLNLTDGRFNESGLEWSMTNRGHAVWTGLYTKPENINKGARIAQDYQMNQTELGRFTHQAPGLEKDLCFLS